MTSPDTLIAAAKAKTVPRPGDPCSCGCGRPVVAAGLARACYSRWDRAGRPASGPPPPLSHAGRTARSTAAHREAMAERMAAYAWARQLGLSIAQAADDAGVSAGWAARKYEHLLGRDHPGKRERSHLRGIKRQAQAQRREEVAA